jgi:ABC-type lipoprotein export system ATPase subunit
MTSFTKYVWESLKQTRPWRLIFYLVLSSLVSLSSAYFYTQFASKYKTFTEGALIYLMLFFTVILLTQDIQLRSKKYRDIFSIQIADLIVEKQLNRLYASSWVVVYNMDDKEISKKSDALKWEVKNYSNKVIEIMFSLLGLLPTIIVLGNVFPVSIFVFPLGMYMFYVFYYKKTFNVEKRSDSIDNTIELWGDYRRCNAALPHQMLHHRKTKGIEEILKINNMIQYAQSERNQDRGKTGSYLYMTNVVCSIFLIWLFVNFVMVEYWWFPGITDFTPVENIDKILEETIMTFVFYLRDFNSSTRVFITFYESYSSTKLAYDQYIKVMENFTLKEEFPQCKSVESLEFKDLHYKLTCDEGKRPDFNLTGSAGPFYKGEIVLVNGPSGSGKSKLFDIIGGLIGYKEYKGSVLINEKLQVFKFEAMTSKRAIKMQGNASCYLNSPFNIITGRNYKPNKIGEFRIEIDVKDIHREEEIVWEILELVGNDFIEEKNFHVMYKKKDDTSGGQKARLEVAKTLFELFRSDPSVVILDEPDAALHEDMRIDIIMRIIEYCKKNQKILFVSLHSSDVKKAVKFDHIITINKGAIHL